MRRVNKLKFMNYIRLAVGVLLLTILLAAPFFNPLQKYLSIPSEIVALNDGLTLDVPRLGETVQIDSSKRNIKPIDSSTIIANSGNSHIFYEVSGIPIKKVN